MTGRTDSPWPPALLTADPVTDPGSPTRALRPRALRLRPVRAFSPPRAPHMPHVTNSLCGGGVSRGTGARGPGRCRVPIRSAHSPQESTQQGARRAPGAYRLCCGLACGDDARAPRHRASGPALRGRSARPRRHVSLILIPNDVWTRLARPEPQPAENADAPPGPDGPGPRGGGQTKHET